MKVNQLLLIGFYWFIFKVLLMLIENKFGTYFKEIEDIEKISIDQNEYLQGNQEQSNEENTINLKVTGKVTNDSNWWFLRSWSKTFFII